MVAHVLVYRATGGRLGQRVPSVPPMLLLDHVGARTGRRRTTPLVYMPIEDDFLIVGAKGGHPRDPAWMHNLRAHPEVGIQVGRRRLEVRAREVWEEDERRRLWDGAVEYNAHWRRYRRRTDRVIPLVILSVDAGDDLAQRPDV